MALKRKGERETGSRKSDGWTVKNTCLALTDRSGGREAENWRVTAHCNLGGVAAVCHLFFFISANISGRVLHRMLNFTPKA